ncbi:PQQ-binding-like beta-propeller repeat protein [Actinomycetes bacterium KLBMP 9797]
MVIDLGEVRQVPEAAVPPTGPSLSPGMRRGLAALGAVVALVAAGGAAPVRGHLREVIAMTDATHAFVGGDAVYVAGADTIARHEIPSGAEKWRVSVPASGRQGGAFAFGGMVLVTVEGSESETIALDGETGERRWRRPGSPSPTGDDRVLLSHQRPGEITVRYAMVDVGTGVARWTLTDLAGDHVYYDDKRFVRWSPTGRIEVRDLGTGQVLATGAVPPPDVDTAQSPAGSGLALAGGMMLVARQRGGQAMADAYDLERFTRRWTAVLDMSFEYPTLCGDLLCVNDFSGDGGVRALDPDTGRVRWTNDQTGWIERIGPVLLSYGDPEQPPPVRVLDPANGHLRADLGRWKIGWPIADDGRVIATREDAERNTWIAELDLFGGAVRILGVARDTYNCDAGEWMVICQRAGGAIGIWYPRRRLDE